MCCWADTGGAGQALAPALLLETNALLVIAGRSLDKATACAERLRQEHPAHAGRVRAAQADAERPESLAQLLAPPAMLLDLTTAPPGHIDLSRYSMDAYLRIVTYKTAFYTFYLPVAAGLVLAGEARPAAFELAKSICVTMGQCF